MYRNRQKARPMKRKRDRVKVRGARKQAAARYWRSIWTWTGREQRRSRQAWAAGERQIRESWRAEVSDAS